MAKSVACDGLKFLFGQLLLLPSETNYTMRKCYTNFMGNMKQQVSSNLYTPNLAHSNSLRNFTIQRKHKEKSSPMQYIQNKGNKSKDYKE